MEVSKKMDDVHKELKDDIRSVDASLTAHRQDTEAHHGVYGVRED